MVGKIKLRLKPMGRVYALGSVKKAYVDDGFLELGEYEFTLEELRKHRIQTGKAGADSKHENALGGI